MLTMCLKEKKWEWTGDMYPYFMKRQMSNMESVVVCPEILLDASRHDKEKNEAHNTWIYEEKKETFERLRKSLGFEDPCPHFYVPHKTIGYLEAYLLFSWPGKSF